MSALFVLVQYEPISVIIMVPSRPVAHHRLKTRLKPARVFGAGPPRPPAFEIFRAIRPARSWYIRNEQHATEISTWVPC
eukprot:6118073-Prymnesium_polylepis.1